MESAKIEQSIYSKYFKRILDFVLSLIAILVLSPLLIVVAILIRMGSEGPIFFRQERPGKNQKIFKVYKFRTMVKDAVKQQKVGVEVTGSDIRITPFGKFLRRFKIDELAQLINILKGDMSIVGPRPTLPEYIEQYEEWELKRFDVRPGLTGLAQINGNIYLDRQEKSAYDVKYVENISFINDIKIILKTVAIVFLGEDKFVNKTDSKIREENSDK
ncbi:sugar transferase [Fusibacter tunisiensis]|uniref:Lipopolysaccharide/colanic/teichoic acid biosynthesis glycosyltransferase n=1 Tax=Fusibacter tunisiensis TaxID=1008308 RepID=A0ABS2MND3_9FIRM|nr:sugar transferase [Fusibacter tunisiensis]MBM7560900.1 lipopolysaccharide/colanic/teichoic acid biosynthesis glycosyltransferase [Fusibacter tunisiensis]